MYRIPTMHNFSSEFTNQDNLPVASQQVQQDYPQLSHQNMHLTSGKEGALIERVANKLNKNREKVINIIGSEQIDRF